MAEHITAELAARHEALFIRLERLLQQADAVAAKRPSTPVPAETRAAAETLLYDTEHLLAPRRRSRPLPPAAESFGGLATQLGQALARLDAFEASHAAWNATLNCRAWRAGPNGALPVQRLRPQLAGTAADPKQTREHKEMRRKILRRFDERYEEGYERALKDAGERGLEAALKAYADSEMQKT